MSETDKTDDDDWGLSPLVACLPIIIDMMKAQRVVSREEWAWARDGGAT